MPRKQKSRSNTSSQLSVRCDADLKEQYAAVLEDKGRSMSDDLREHMEHVVSAAETSSSYGVNDQLPEDETLRKAYHVLNKYVDPDTRSIDVDAAESLLADKTNTPKRIVRSRIIEPLEDRGLLRPYWGSVVVAAVE